MSHEAKRLHVRDFVMYLNFLLINDDFTMWSHDCHSNAKVL